jgi:hypothetical protein
MSQDKLDILLFLLYIVILIFAEKIFDDHHAYELIHMNLVTCIGKAKAWRSISKICAIIIHQKIKIITFRYNAPRNKSFDHRAEWNTMKIMYIGKFES